MRENQLHEVMVVVVASDPVGDRFRTRIEVVEHGSASTCDDECDATDLLEALVAVLVPVQDQVRSVRFRILTKSVAVWRS